MSNIKFGLRTRNGLIRPIIESSDYDIDARAYFAVNTAITSPLDKRAISDFYGGLKSDGIYTKIRAMYLPLWSSASANKWNLVNPLDTNAAFRLTFHGTSWAYSSGGMTPTNAYANTYITSLTTNSNSLGSYVRTNQTSNAVICGSYISGLQMYQMNISTGTGYYYYSTTTNVETASAIADSKGFFIATTRSSNDREIYRNGTSLTTKTTNETTGNTNIANYLGSRNANGVADTFSSQQISFHFQGLGLTDAEVTNFNTRVNTLMTHFGINV